VALLGGLVGVYSDASRRLRAEFEQREILARRHWAVLDTLVESVAVLGERGEMLEVNKQGARSFGRSRDELIGSVPRDDVNAVYEDGSPMLPDETLSQRVLRTGESVTDTIVGITRSDGARRWLLVSAQRIEPSDWGHKAVAVVTSFDVTERHELLRELSTPTLRIREGLLVMPVIGRLTPGRVELLTERLLDRIRADRARAVILDLTGLPAIDAKAADKLLQTAEAARLMGARVVVTGLSADVAATLDQLDIWSLPAANDLQGGIEQAERILAQRPVTPSRLL
jgi:PAS domain S-box-containing protein